MHVAAPAGPRGGAACLASLTTRCLSLLPTDYGPYGFLERFDPDFTPNTTDLPGRRYCFRCAV